VLGAGHGVGGGHHAVGEGEVGFANGAIDFAGAGRGFEAVGEEEALEGDAGGPDIFEGDDVFGLEVEEFALGLQDARIRREHEAVFFDHEGVGLFCPREHFFAVFESHEFGVGVLIGGGWRRGRGG